MPERAELIWLFFKVSGRVSRAAYLLTFMFLLVVVSFPLYQFMRVPEDSAAAQAWSVVFGLVFLVFLWAHVTTSVKRLHDIGKPGIMAISLFIPVVSIVAFVVLCMFPGEPGPNRYGARTNAPA